MCLLLQLPHPGLLLESLTDLSPTRRSFKSSRFRVSGFWLGVLGFLFGISKTVRVTYVRGKGSFHGSLKDLEGGLNGFVVGSMWAKKSLGEPKEASI